MPVIGSSLSLRCAIVHDGEIRRSDRAFSEATKRGMSAADMAAMVRWFVVRR